MTVAVAPETLAAICGIALEHRRNDGWALRRLVSSSGYARVRPELTEQILTEYIREHPEIIAQWDGYSSDKRTDGGWEFHADRGPGWGWVGGPEGFKKGVPDQVFPSAAPACACYILRELDWLSQPATLRDIYEGIMWLIAFPFNR